MMIGNNSIGRTSEIGGKYICSCKGIMKRILKQLWSSISPLLTKRTISSHMRRECKCIKEIMNSKQQVTLLTFCQFYFTIIDCLAGLLFSSVLNCFVCFAVMLFLSLQVYCLAVVLYCWFCSCVFRRFTV